MCVLVLAVFDSGRSFTERVTGAVVIVSAVLDSGRFNEGLAGVCVTVSLLYLTPVGHLPGGWQ